MSMLDNHRYFKPRGGVDTRIVVPGAHEELERATKIAFPCPGTQPSSARDGVILTGPWI